MAAERRELLIANGVVCLRRALDMLGAAKDAFVRGGSDQEALDALDEAISAVELVEDYNP